jgi:hypothetical protein
VVGEGDVREGEVEARRRRKKRRGERARGGGGFMEQNFKIL